MSVLNFDKSTGALSLYDGDDVCVFYDFGRNRSNMSDMLDLFGKDMSDDGVICDNTHPWVMRLNHMLVLYFGGDKPFIDLKSVKTKTKDYVKWNPYTQKNKQKMETYHYAVVKEPKKLFIFSSEYGFNRTKEEPFRDQYLTRF